MVLQERVELPTFRLQNGCSTRLSYKSLSTKLVHALRTHVRDRLIRAVWSFARGGRSSSCGERYFDFSLSATTFYAANASGY